MVNSNLQISTPLFGAIFKHGNKFSTGFLHTTPEPFNNPAIYQVGKSRHNISYWCRHFIRQCSLIYNGILDDLSMTGIINCHIEITVSFVKIKSSKKLQPVISGIIISSDIVKFIIKTFCLLTQDVFFCLIITVEGSTANLSQMCIHSLWK